MVDQLSLKEFADLFTCGLFYLVVTSIIKI